MKLKRGRTRRVNFKEVRERVADNSATHNPRLAPILPLRCRRPDPGDDLRLFPRRRHHRAGRRPPRPRLHRYRVNLSYAAMAEGRVRGDAPLFVEIAAL